MTTEHGPPLHGSDAGNGPLSHRKAVRVLAIVHFLGTVSVVVGVAVGNEQSSAWLLITEVLAGLLLGLFSFVFWILLWHYNLRHVIAGLRLSKHIASPYVVEEIDAAKWIRVGSAFALNRALQGDEILRLQGLNAQLFGLRLAPTPEGLAAKWFPRQRRLIPWPEVTPLTRVHPNDIARADSPFSRMISAVLKVRSMAQFSSMQSPDELFLLRGSIAGKLQQASQNRWRTAPTHQPPPPQPQPPPPPPPPPRVS